METMVDLETSLGDYYRNLGESYFSGHMVAMKVDDGDDMLVELV